MKTVFLHDKQKIWEFLQRNKFLHLYLIGDLDEFFWPYTTWYALMDGQNIVQLALLYCGSSLPVLLAVSQESSAEIQILLRSIIPFLPKKFYAHLHSATAEIFVDDYQLQSHGVHYKMALLRPDQIENVDTTHVSVLSKADLAEIEALYRMSYPGNWFDARMMETGYYYGIWKDSKLLSVAGIHVYAKQYGVAALGNVASHPAYRGQKLATQVSAKLCQSLLKTVNSIGLNVQIDNNAAIACYTHLGFERIAIYEEFMCTLK